jgi:hypothetical protein
VVTNRHPHGVDKDDSFLSLTRGSNKDKIYRCEDKNYSQPTELEDGTKFDGVDTTDFDGADEDEEQTTEPSLHEKRKHPEWF